MRYVWLVFVGLLVAMVLVLPRLNKPAVPSASLQPAAMPVERTASFIAAPPAAPPRLAARADSVVAFGLAQQGTPYVYAGTSPLTGFDCSGFIMYTFAHFNVAVPHSTTQLIDVGQPVARAEAQPGDIVVFTGTAETSTTPGHAGIIISSRGEKPLRFVHASSARREPFVKVSQVEGTDYERRFMQVRRVLGESGQVAATRPMRPASASLATPVAPLPKRQVAVAPSAAPMPALPQKLASKKTTSKKYAQHTATKKKVATKPTASRKTSKKKPVAVAKRKVASKSAPARAKKRTLR